MSSSPFIVIFDSAAFLLRADAWQERFRRLASPRHFLLASALLLFEIPARSESAWSLGLPRYIFVCYKITTLPPGLTSAFSAHRSHCTSLMPDVAFRLRVAHEICRWHAAALSPPFQCWSFSHQCRRCRFQAARPLWPFLLMLLAYAFICRYATIMLTFSHTRLRLYRKLLIWPTAVPTYSRVPAAREPMLAFIICYFLEYDFGHHFKTVAAAASFEPSRYKSIYYIDSRPRASFSIEHRFCLRRLAWSSDQAPSKIFCSSAKPTVMQRVDIHGSPRSPHA